MRKNGVPVECVTVAEIPPDESVTPRRGNEWGLIAIVFAVALVARLAVVLSMDPQDAYFYDRHYVQYARNFAEDKGFYGENPYGPAGPEKVYAFRPPLFPLLWGLVYKATGGAYTPIRLAFAVLSAFTCVLAFLVGRHLFRRRRVAFIGALGVALYPPLIWHGVQLMTEPLFIFFGVAFILFLLRLHERRLRLDAAMAGVALALAILSRSALIAFVPVAGLWILFALKGEHWRRRVALALLYGCAWLAVMAPWAIRNAIVLQGLVVTTTDSAHGFYIANRPEALTDERGFRMPRPEEWNFVLKPGETHLGEIEIQSRIYQHTYSYLLKNPAVWTRLMWDRFLRLWRFYPHANIVGRKVAILYAISYIPLFPFMVIGLVLAYREQRASRAKYVLMYLLVACTTLIYTYFMATLRYRVPLMPFLILFAAYAFWRLVDWVRGRRQEYRP